MTNDMLEHTTADRGDARPGAKDDRFGTPTRGLREDFMPSTRHLARLLLILGSTSLLAGAAWAGPASRVSDPAGGTPHVERTAAVVSVPVLGTAVVNLAELSRLSAGVQDALRPPVRPLIENERDGEEDIDQPDEAGLAASSPFSVGRQLTIASPAPTKSFAGLDDIPMADSSYQIIPPDVNGAVGTTAVFQNLNNNVRVIDKATGNVLSTVGVNTWWAATGASPNNYTDPRSVFDPYNSRFITIQQGDLDQSTANSICLGISDSSDPNGTWHLYRFSAYESSTYQYADFPTLGFNRDWVTISINMYNSTQSTVRRSVFMVHYPTLLTSHTATVFRADYGTSNVICGAPVVTYSATCDTEYVVQRRGTSTYSLDMITGTGPGAPTYTIGAALTRPGGTWNALGTSNYFPQSAPVAGTSVCGATPCGIERNDDNVRTPPVYRAGSIWFAQAVGLPSSSTTHVASQWTQIAAPGGAFVVGGRLQDTLATTTNGRPHYGNPSISVNANGDFLLGFTRFSSGQHPGAGYAMHVAADGIGTLRDTVVYHDGEDYYHKTFSTNTGRNRWGDFSTTMVDPSDDLTLWTVQEYAKTRTGTDDGVTGTNSSKWGTWWAGVTPGNTFAITASAGSGGGISPAGTVAVNQGGNQTFTITPAACNQVANVLVDGVSQGAITTYTFTNVQAAHTISATFSALGPYAIVASAGANGSITPAGSTNVTCGGSQAYTITPASCYHVAGVLVDGVSQGAITTYTFSNVTATHTISATFAINGPFTITASSGVNGTVTPAGPTSVACGGSQGYTIAPAANYHVASVLVDGVSVGSPTSYTFSGVSASHTLSATFAMSQYTITATADSNGTISPSGANVVNAGTSPAFTLAPHSGFYLSNLLVDSVAVAPVPLYTFTNVQANHTIDSHFSSDVSTIGGTSVTTTVGPFHPCDTLVVALARHGGTPVLGYSVSFQLSPDLVLCSGVASIAEGGFLDGSGATLFDVVDHGGGLYTVDDALTANCGPSSTGGTLFSLAVTSTAAGGTGTVTIGALKLRDCSNAALPATAGPPASVPYDNQAPLVTVTSPNGGEAMNAGDVFPLAWTASDNVGVAGVTLLLSRAGAGGPFDTLATGVTAPPPFAWTVVGPSTSDAILKVVATDAAGNAGSDVSDAPFAISASSGVGGNRPLVFALMPVTPNPGHGNGVVRYAVARTADIRLSILDLQGREVSVLASGSHEPGLYQARWAGDTPSGGQATAGVYFVRYQTPGKTFVQRLVLTR